MIFGYNNLFLPSDDGNTLIWLDSTDPLGNGTIPTNGSSLSTWNDKSKNGFVFSQASGAQQPVNVNNYIKSNNILNFNISSNSVMASNSAITFAASVSVLGTVSISSTSESYIFDPSGFGSSSELFIKTTSNVLQAGNSVNPGGTFGQVNGAASTNTFYIFSYVYNSAGSSSLWLNGTLAGTSSSASGHSLATTFTRLIGNNNSLGFNFKGYIGDFIVANTAWTTGVRRQMELYAATKWGVAIA